MVPVVRAALFISTPLLLSIPPETSCLSHADEAEDHPQLITVHSDTVTGPPSRSHTHTHRLRHAHARTHSLPPCVRPHKKPSHTHTRARTSHELIWRTNYRGSERRGERRLRDGGLEQENGREHGQWSKEEEGGKDLRRGKCRGRGGMRRNERMEEWDKRL